MTPLIAGLLAITAYLAGTSLQYFQLTRPKQFRRRVVLIVGAIALILHGVSLAETLISKAGFDLGLYSVLSLISWMITLIIVLSSISKPLENLLIGIFPIASMSIAISFFLKDDSQTLHHFANPTTSHILLSLLSFSVLSIAAVQALLLSMQDRHLHQHKATGFIMHLPALQMMEQLLFELLWVGVLLLTASIVTGSLYLEDLFAQHLLHKSTLSIVAWVIFSTLLLGRHLMGWRSKLVIRWTLTAYLLLLVGYLGSKLVLEIILNRV